MAEDLQDNATRAGRAASTLLDYAERSDVTDEDVIDLITDLLHYVQRQEQPGGAPPAAVMEAAWTHFTHEIGIPAAMHLQPGG